MSFSRKKPLVVALLVLVAVVVLLELTPAEERDNTAIASIRLPVTVATAMPASESLVVTITGTTAPRWPVTMTSLLTGQVDYVDAELEPGVLLQAGQLLARLDPVHLLADAEQAQWRVANAELTLAREQHEQTVALKQLARHRSTAFARRELQIAAASAELKAAKQALRSARQRVADSEVIAPFAAVVLRRVVVPGQQVQQGDELLQLAASDSVDVVVPLSEQVWQRLGSKMPTHAITVRDRQGQSWPARIRYLDPSVDENTRQRQLVLSVSDPYAKTRNSQLYPDQQVSVEIALPEQMNVVRLPLSVLTEDAQVWSLSQQDTLQLEEVTLLQQNGHEIWLQFHKNKNQARRIAVFPLSSMLEGQQVLPKMRVDKPQLEASL
tara:strand:+ start:724 stop:1869 length:1146 start_codon:yes stop_codon:yes gene_type:complete